MQFAACSRTQSRASGQSESASARLLPFQLDHINLWLVEDGVGWAIVDTGVGLDGVRALWERIFVDHLGGRSRA